MSTANNQNTTVITTSSTPQQVPARGDNTFLEEGKSAAITVNTPFTVIPGLPALSKILAKIDKTTQQDLGFTFKGSAAKIPNQQGEQDLQLNIDYIGFGWMSSKFNVQFSPVSIKVESGLANTEPHWGCSASVLSSPIGLVHERAGVKGTFSDCNSTRTFSAAPEISYQSSKTFKPLSTATGGYFFGDKGTFRIPAEYVPTLERIKAASPGIEEWEIITDHIAPSIPALQIGRLIDQNIEIAGNIIKSATSMVESAIAPAAKSKIDRIDKLTHQPDAQSSQSPAQASAQPAAASVNDKNTSPVHTNRSINGNNLDITSAATQTTPEDSIKKKQRIAQETEPSIEEKANYTVQQNDTLTKIGKKTGHAWTEIYALNKSTLKNNPDKIYPGQELLIPETHDHTAIIKHPVVQAQILANLAKHYAQQDEHALQR